MTAEEKEICKHCDFPRYRHLRSSLVEHWDCPRFNPSVGSTHFEPINPKSELERFKSALREEIEKEKRFVGTSGASILFKQGYTEALIRMENIIDSVTPKP